MYIGSDLLAYPNPADDVLYLRSMKTDVSNAQLVVTDVAGRNVISQTINLVGGDAHNISTANLKPGVYFIRVFNGKNYDERLRFVKK